MRNLSITSLTILALGTSSCIFAADMDTRVKELETKMEKVYTKTANGADGAKTANARPEPHGNGWWINLDALYWHTKVGGTEYVQTTTTVATTGNTNTGSFNQVDPDWAWGFKVGIGYKYDHDGWDSHLEYTYFRPSDSSRTTVAAPAGLIALRGNSLVSEDNLTDSSGGFQFCTTATSDFQYQYDNINLEIGRNYFVSRSLSLRPHVGLRTLWLDLQQTTRYTGGDNILSNGEVAVTFLGNNTVEVVDRSDFWGLGLRTGFDTKWHLTNGFSIFGDVSGALLWGRFETRMRTTFSPTPANLHNLRNDFHRIVPAVNLILGLAYDQYIYNDKQHIGISLGYDTQYLWRVNQMMVPNFNASAPTASSVSEDVSIQGVTFEIRWDF
ncbi:MOMP family protein [Candidatus Aerophobetes bacterium]|uniref:MOMP family protein n=1 Tax=Aerophobetes bacterium TaxID=2030807 RepID=A0A2A4YDB8_UNCAE|nr:MAG: MOMP family protein [Candidatus Aerophobetes bacterium]